VVTNHRVLQSTSIICSFLFEIHNNNNKNLFLPAIRAIDYKRRE
jgi:hypothetical protein